MSVFAFKERKTNWNWKIKTEITLPDTLPHTLIHEKTAVYIHGNTCNTSKMIRQGSHSFTDKKSRTFPGLYRTTMKNFPGPFRSLRMFKYKEKTAFTYNILSVVHCRKFRWSKMWTLAVQNWDELIYIWSQYTCSDCRSSLEVFQFK